MMIFLGMNNPSKIDYKTLAGFDRKSCLIAGQFYDCDSNGTFLALIMKIGLFKIALIKTTARCTSLFPVFLIWSDFLQGFFFSYQLSLLKYSAKPFNPATLPMSSYAAPFIFLKLFSVYFLLFITFIHILVVFFY